MSLRLRLIVAFFLFSVVPLAAVTFYSYTSNLRALRVAAQRETEMLTSELTQRMQVVTSQISERVQHVMDIQTPASTTVVAGTSGTAPSSSRRAVPRPSTAPRHAAVPAPAVPPAAAAPALDPNAVETQVAGALGEVAMLLNNVEVRGMGRMGGPAPPQPGGPAADVPGAPAASHRPFPPDHLPSGPGRHLRSGPPAPEGQREHAGVSGAQRPPPPGSPDDSNPDETRMRVDLAPIRRELFHQMAPNGSFDQMTLEDRQRIGREVNQRLLGIVQGIQLGAAEVQKKAAAAQAAAASAAASAPVQAKAAKPVTHKLTGTNLAVKVERNGQVVRQVNAEINLPNLLATVFANTRRDSGEIPFAIGKDGRLYAPTDVDREKLEQLDVAHDTIGTTRRDDWIVVTRPDQSGAGLRFGIARPVGNLLSDLRRTTARNAGFGLLFIGIALAGMVPLSGRLTRNLTVLTDGVGRIAKGDYAARVPVQSRDEVGRLADAFNRMAADVEQHQRAAVEQERIRRELELGRLIQHEMLPHTPLHLGLTEVKGVSVPASEVGGDFFNYFELQSGSVALLVGDVSGKGVGAALLMANIQASLRARFALGQELSAIAEAIDRDIEANTPGPVYATLFMAIFDPATRRMRYVNAGHNPQFVLRTDGRLEKMWSTGLPVGLLAGHGYGERVMQLASGDLLFFYTDGCVEMENDADEMFGSDRLESLVAATARAGADAVLARVEQEIATFRGHRELFDDATMMAVTVG